MIHITTLSENCANMGFLAEWGLSILIQTQEGEILLDTGLSVSTIQNADVLDIDLADMDKIVLSHGHVDHTGGLRRVLQRTGEIEVIAHPDIWSTRYFQEQTGKYLAAGIPFSREELEGLGACFNLTTEPLKITEDIITSGEIPMTTSYEEIDPNLFVKREDALYPDPIADDMALFIKTEQGLVVILGCAHRGIINTLRHAQKLTGEERIDTVVGGYHLFLASPQRIEQTIADLKKMKIRRIGVSHCTGFQASARLAQEFGDAFFLNNAGSRFSIP
jgi:7,8-dihydropterin-6-yl-methyl-4-(beta-D-ribofuranosyl)aminobenzene 5'-phosphate synthase